MSGLFSTLNISTRGMAAQQGAIDVTSHNIANVNTPGYSRQRAVIETTTPYTMPSMHNAAEAGQMGTGATVSAIERYRDAFLDYQTRVETSSKGQSDIRQTVLGQVESIFNEPSTTGISDLMGKFFDSWQQLSKQPDSSDSRTVVAQQSSALADELNNVYNQLTSLQQNVQLEIKGTVVDANSKLDQIDKLNQQIVGVGVTGNEANDLMDKRDTLIDGLSTEFNLNVTKQPYNGIDIAPVDTSGVASPNMVDATLTGNEKKLSYISDISATPTAGDPNQYTLTYYALGDSSNSANKHTLTIDINPASATDVAALQSIKENRVIWADNKGIAVDSTSSSGADLVDNAAGPAYNVNQLSLFKPSDGQFQGYTSVQKDIDNYMDDLNKLAKTLAFAVNSIHSGTADPLNSSSPSGIDSMPFFVNSDVAQYDANNNLTNLVNQGGPPAVQGTLNNEAGITAGNISVNKSILNNVMNIKTRTSDNLFDSDSADNIEGAKDGARALAIAGLKNTLMSIDSVTATSIRVNLLGGTLSNNGMTIANSTSGMTMDNYFKDTIDKLGIQSQQAQNLATSQQALLDNFNDSRASISGVSIDEETANMVQYEHAYQANAKVIATVDELLDVVINGLKK